MERQPPSFSVKIALIVAISGIAVAAIGVDNAQGDAVGGERVDRPEALGDPVRAAKQVADALLVLLQLDFLAVEGKFALRDAVRAAAGCRAEIGGMQRIVLELFEAERQRRVVAFQPQS